MSPSAVISSYPSPRFQKSASTTTDITLTETISEDNKDVLIERLNDLVQRLSKDHTVEDNVVSRLHREVDDMEIVMIKANMSQKMELELGTRTVEPSLPSSNSFFWDPETPTRKISIPRSDSLRRTPPREQRMDTAAATRIAQEAEALAAQLSKSIAELQQRREEADVRREELNARGPSS